MAGLNFTNLNNSLGAYCREMSSEILSGIFSGLQTLTHATQVNGKDEIPLVTLDSTNIVQPSRRNNAWNPTDNGLAFGARVLKLRPAKVDLEIIPSQFFATFLGHNAQRGANKMEPITFEQFLMDEIIRRAAEDTEWVLHNGVFHASNTTLVSTLNGTKKILDIEIDDEESITPVDISAWTNTNAVDQVEEIFDSVPEKMKTLPLKFYCAPDVKAKYEKDYRATFGSLPYNTEFRKTLIDGTLCELVALPGMAGQSQVFITRAANYFIGQDDDADLNNIEVEKNRRGLDIMMDFSIGVEFARTSEIVVGRVTA